MQTEQSIREKIKEYEEKQKTDKYLQYGLMIALLRWVLMED